MDVQQQLLGRHGNKISHQLKTKKYKVLKETEFCIHMFEVFFVTLNSLFDYDNKESSLSWDYQTNDLVILL